MTANLSRRVDVTVAFRAQGDLPQTLDATKGKAEAAAAALDRMKAAVPGAAAAVPPPAPSATSLAAARIAPGATLAGEGAAAMSPMLGAAASVEVRTQSATEKAIERTEAALRKQVATFGMTRNEIKAYELAQRGATEADLAGVRALGAQEAALKKEAMAVREAEAAAGGGPFLTREGRAQGRLIGRIGRGAGLFAASMAASQIGGTWGNVATGGLMGAAAGASIAGPWGAAVGAALGGIPPIIHDIADSCDKAKAAAEKLKEEAGKTASAIFGSEAEIRALRGGAGVTAASLTAAAPEAAAHVAEAGATAPLGMAMMASTVALRNEGEAAYREVLRLTALTTPAGLEAARAEERRRSRVEHAGDLLHADPGTLWGPAELAAPTASELAAARRRSEVLAHAVAEGIAGVTRHDTATIAGGASGGAGFISDTLTTALLGGGPADRSVDLLTEIRDLLRGAPA